MTAPSIGWPPGRPVPMILSSDLGKPAIRHDLTNRGFIGIRSVSSSSPGRSTAAADCRWAKPPQWNESGVTSVAMTPKSLST
jgi:hypothetical protein